MPLVHPDLATARMLRVYPLTSFAAGFISRRTGWAKVNSAPPGGGRSEQPAGGHPREVSSEGGDLAEVRKSP